MRYVHDGKRVYHSRYGPAVVKRCTEVDLKRVYNGFISTSQNDSDDDEGETRYKYILKFDNPFISDQYIGPNHISLEELFELGGGNNVSPSPYKGKKEANNNPISGRSSEVW